MLVPYKVFTNLDVSPEKEVKQIQKAAAAAILEKKKKVSKVIKST